MWLFFLISWVVGLIMVISFTIVAWIKKDKEAWDMIPIMFIAFLLIGWLITFPFIIALFIIKLNERFD